MGLVFLLVVIGLLLVLLLRPNLTGWEIPYWTAPLAGVLILGCSGKIPRSVFHAGFFGDDSIQPYAVLIFFMTQAYLCIALDSSGLFTRIAHQLTLKAGDSGVKAFSYFFLMSSIITLITSNDIVILTLTPIITHFNALSRTSNPEVFLLGKFFAANVLSCGLLTGNPTNIIVSIAADISFPEYSLWMTLPTIISGCVLYLMFRIVFKSALRAPININMSSMRELEASEKKAFDRRSAIVGSVILVSCLMCLAFTPLLKFPPHYITSFFCIIYLCLNLFVLMPFWKSKFPVKNNLFQEVEEEEQELRSDEQEKYTGKTEEAAPTTRSSNLGIIRSLPWSVVPFVLSMFILVESLDYAGYVQNFADAFAKVARSGKISAMLCMWITSTIFGNILNNQPMTILFTKILLKTPKYSSFKLSAFALILGSNVTANLTFVGALAGIMWIRILRSKESFISPLTFAFYGLLTMIPVSLTFIFVLLIESFVLG